ncbi:MAG: ATP synthase F1 subunit delta, partial [Candidatus Kapabacteria bacterium]|nr:ATP synthase F1 subunit delta [Candidatus Kapabacteria bacterium]
MTEQRVSLRYARAIFETAKLAGVIDNVYNDFKTINNYLNTSGELSAIMKSPVIKTWKKKEIIKELFSGIVSEMSYNFLQLIAEKQRENFILDIISSYESIYLQEKNIIKADIITARELNDVLKTKILSELSSKLQKQIIPNFKIEPDIKGGLMVRIEDKIYDASVKNQLARL